MESQQDDQDDQDRERGREQGQPESASSPRRVHGNRWPADASRAQSAVEMRSVAEAERLAAYASPDGPPSAERRSIRFGSDDESCVDDMKPPGGETFWQLCQMVMAASLPAAMSLAMEFFTTIIVIRFVGHFADSDHMSGTGLALTLANISMALNIGLLNAMSTLIPQALGDNNPRMVGATLQRGLLLTTLCTLFVCGFWLLGEPIMKLIGQHEHSAQDAGLFLRALMVGIWPLSLFNAVNTYLRGQDIWWPACFVLFAGNCAQIGLSQLFIYGSGTYDGTGYIGAPFAMACQRWLVCILLILVVIVRGYHKDTWFGWSAADMFSTEGLKEFLKLGVPAALSLFSEALGYEILTILAGYLGSDELAAMSLVSQVYLFVWFAYLGVSGATSYLVGVRIGANEPQEAQRVGFAAVSVTVVLAFGSGLLLYFAGHAMAHSLAANDRIARIATKLFHYAAFVHVVDVSQCTCSGILLGLGLPMRSFKLNLLSYYVIAFPVAYVLAYHSSIGIEGIWIGLLAGVSVITVSHLVWFRYYADYPALCQVALQRSEDERSRAAVYDATSPSLNDDTLGVGLLSGSSHM